MSKGRTLGGAKLYKVEDEATGNKGAAGVETE